MTYQVQREKKYFVEDLELLDTEGNVIETIHVQLDPGSVVENVSRRYLELVRAQQELSSIDGQNPGSVQDAYAKLGNAVIAMFAAVFGDKGTERILAYYDDNYVEMIKQICPFITEFVMPEIRQMAKDNKQQVLQNYNRKTRRALKRIK